VPDENQELEVAQLFALRPAEFVAARDRLATALRRQGRKEDAASVKALPRPSPSAFAVNQLARRDPTGLARLEDATAALERTQGADAGEEGRRAYRQALAQQREALERLIEQARQGLEEAGLAAGRAILDRVASNLRFAMLDDDTRALVRQGRLGRDVEAPDLSALLERFPAAGGTPGPAHKAAPRPTAAAPPPHRATAASHPPAKDAAAARLRERLEGLRERHETAQADVASTRDKAAAAEQAHRHAEDTLKSLRRQLAEREREAAEAGRTATSARRAQAQATAALDRLATELARLEREID
jgi:hypothetical protein